MIGYVKGTVERIFASSVFIDVHGVGYRVYAPVSTLAHLNVGEESLLYTYMNTISLCFSSALTVWDLR